MKRLRRANEVETEGFNMANVSMLLSHGQADADDRRVFECQTCKRRFTSFQALGGHRASHKKPKLSSSSSNEDDHNNQSIIKPKVHECSICGIEFATWQALGGHMRRHKATINGEGFAEKKKPNYSGKRVLLLDLNFPPLDDEVEYGKLRIGLGVVNSMVDYCFL